MAYNTEDMIAVPRGMLAAAAYCARKHAGADSEVYRQISAAARSAPVAVGNAGDMVLVPKEPTFDMKMAGAKAITLETMQAAANYDAAIDSWIAMLAAAPATQRPHVEGGR